MRNLFERLADLWTEKVYPKVSSFVAFFGVFWLVLCVLAAYLLAELSDEVLEQEAFALDESILRFIHQFSSPTLDNIVVGITRIGDPKTVVPLTAIVLLFLWFKRYRIEATIFALDAFGGAVLSYFLKLAFNKDRPQLWDSPIVETTYSYPSGHALGSIVLYGFLSYVFATIYPRFAGWFYGVAVFLVVSIGLSRLYLGVHWPTDIVGGYCIGFLWIMVCITLIRLLRAKRDKRKDQWLSRENL